MALLLLIWLSAAQGAAAPLPDREEFARNLRRGLQRDAEVLGAYTWIEQRRDVKISRLGRVTIGPLRTFEVYPDGAGGAYKRLIAIDGTPLTPEELARRDAEHEKNLREAAERRRRETADQREARSDRAEKERREREAMLADAFAVFEAKLTGRQRISGRSVLVATLTPRSHAHVTTREGGWMKQFEGQILVDEQTHQVVRLDMRAVRDVTIGWGVIGRIHEGSRVHVTRQWIDNAWLPAQTTYEATGRTLLFRSFQFSVTTTYSNYKRRSGPAPPGG